MVRRAILRRFLRDEAGLSLTEALIVMPVVLICITVMVELGFAVFHWNQTVKAVNVGARHVAISSPLMTRATYDAAMTADFGTVPQGDPTPAGAVSVSCGAGATACDTAAMNRLLTGGDGICGDGSTLFGMCDFAPWLNAENILVTYFRSGLGYVGRPFGQVSTITLELSGVTFDFMILDALIPILGTIDHPPHRASTTSEDLSSCVTPC